MACFADVRLITYLHRECLKSRMLVLHGYDTCSISIGPMKRIKIGRIKAKKKHMDAPISIVIMELPTFMDVSGS